MKRADWCSNCDTLLQARYDCHVCHTPYPWHQSPIKLFSLPSRWKTRKHISYGCSYRRTPAGQAEVGDLVFPGDRIVIHEDWFLRRYAGTPIRGTVHSVLLQVRRLHGRDYRTWSISYYPDIAPSIKGEGYPFTNHWVAVDGKIVQLFTSTDAWVEVIQQPTASKQLSLFP